MVCYLLTLIFLLSNWQQNIYNKELAEYQNAWNLEMWNKQNEYNSPVETMKRLTDAGINPRNSTNLSSFANSADVPQATSYSQKAPLSAFSDIAKTALELSNLKKQGNVLDSQVEKNNAEAENKRGIELRSYLDYVNKDPLRWKWEQDAQGYRVAEEERKSEKHRDYQNRELDYQTEKEIAFRLRGLSRYQNIYPNGNLRAFKDFNKWLQLQLDKDSNSYESEMYLKHMRRLEYLDLKALPKSLRGSLFGFQTGKLNKYINDFANWAESLFKE